MIKEVNIGGQVRPVSYGWNALAMFQELSGLTLGELSQIDQSRMSLRSMMQFAYVGLKDGARKYKQPFDHSIEEVADWMDDSPDAFIELFGEFVRSQAPQDGKHQGGGSKKKVK